MDIMTADNLEKDHNEEELLQSIVGNLANRQKTEWLPACFGEREKQLRMKHRLSQQEVADRLGTSVSTISRLENGISTSIEIELIIGLADLYDVSADFLLGIVCEPEKTYFNLKDIGLTPKAGLALYTGKADAPTVNRLLENNIFQGLTYAIRDYIIYSSYGNGNPMPLVMEVSSDSRFQKTLDYSITNQPVRICRYADKMNGLYERGSSEALGKGLQTAVKQVRDGNETYMYDGIKLTAEMLSMIREAVHRDPGVSENMYNTPEYVSEQILKVLAPDGNMTDISRELLASLRNALLTMDLDDEEKTGGVVI